MSRVVPYPVLTAALTLMWLLLNSFSAGHLVLGAAVALFASHAMAALQPAKPRLRRWQLAPQLVWRVLADIAVSNLAVARLVLAPARPGRAGFVEIPLELRDRTGLAVLACIITSSPGTAWVEYDSTSGTLLMHVLELGEAQHWVDLVKTRYEALLLEIFE